MKQTKILSTFLTAIALATAVIGLSTAQAQEKADKVAGTWNWTSSGGNGNELKSAMTLKVEGEKITGKVVTKFGESDDQKLETEVEEAKLKDNELTFKISPEFNGTKLSIKFSGKLDGDTIKGKVEYEVNGESQSRDWEAKREKK